MTPELDDTERAEALRERAAAYEARDAAWGDCARLMRERDEARRIVCRCEAEAKYVDYVPGADAVERIAREIAADRGWDCFAHTNTNDVPVQDGGER